MARPRHRLVAVALAPDSVWQAVILARADPAGEELAGGGRRDLLDRRTALGGELGVGRAALDVDLLHLRADVRRRGADEAEIAVGLLAHLARGAELPGGVLHGVGARSRDH